MLDANSCAREHSQHCRCQQLCQRAQPTLSMPTVAEKGHKMTAQNGSSVVESDDMKLAAMKDASLQLCTLSESVS